MPLHGNRYEGYFFIMTALNIPNISSHASTYQMCDVDKKEVKHECKDGKLQS